MSDRPRYSIVIPTYNRAGTINNTLAGCFAQHVTDLEVVVVDDGSSDDTLSVLSAIQDPRLVVVAQENGGPAAARNHGMRVARGEYIAFLDSDDVWYPGYLSQVDAALGDDPEKVIYSQIIVDRGVGKYWVKPKRAMQPDESIYEFLYVHGGFIQTSTIVIPKALAAKVSWDESVTFGDNDQFAIDCWQTGIRFEMLSKPQTLYADLNAADALSNLYASAGPSEKHTNFFRWMNTQREHMSDAAWHGYRAHFESASFARSEPVKSFKLINTARKAGVIGIVGMCRQLVQTFMPRLYRWLIDNYVRLRGAPLHTFE